MNRKSCVRAVWAPGGNGERQGAKGTNYSNGEAIHCAQKLMKYNIKIKVYYLRLKVTARLLKIIILCTKIHRRAEIV